MTFPAWPALVESAGGVSLARNGAARAVFSGDEGMTEPVKLKTMQSSSQRDNGVKYGTLRIYTRGGCG